MIRLFFALAFLLGAPPAFAGPVEDLHALFAEEWQARLARNPFMATVRGEPGHDDAVPDVSPQAQAAQLAQDKRFLERLEAIDRSALPAGERFNYDLFAHELEGRLALAPYKRWRIPFVSDSGFHTWPVFVVDAMAFETAADYETYLARLEKLPVYLAQNIANMRLGIEDGFTMPRAILDKAEPSFAALAAETPEASAFYRPFADMPETIAVQARARLQAAGHEVLAEGVLPAYEDVLDFFRNEYKLAARESLAATALSDGAAYYAALVRDYTTLEGLGAREIHEIGLAEARRIKAEMVAIIAELGFEGDFLEFLAYLRTDDRFYAETPEELLRRAAWIAKKVDAVMPAYFATLPRTPYGVRPVPEEIAPNYTTGRYLSPVDGRRGGLYWVNTYNLKARPLYELPALTVHEAVPGHHHQIALAREIEGAPDFRTALSVTAFSEGWGLYTERLAEEMGVYETPYERFGRLSYEMWRAGRLVVDTGIHALGWSREEAVAFFEQNSALSEGNIQTEVDRYISWPGQALAYKIGEMKIVELRAKAEDALGAAFDIRTFHDALLVKGAMPLDMLEREVQRYIAARRERAGG